MGDSPNGNARRIINTVISFRKIADKDKEHLDEIIARKTKLQKMIQTLDNTYAEKLAECEEEANELRQMISLKTDCA